MPDDRVIAGKYRLITKLSEGGMGAVWRAEHLELNCPAAVKLLDPAFAESPEAFARFKREAQSAASLRSTNIVQIFDFGLDDGVPYIAMELLRGQSLAERLSEKCPLSPRETAVILSQVAKAVTWAHGMGIVHRDLKPGNIFLSEDAGETVVKLVDFGIAKPLHLDLSDAPVTMTGSIMGTPQYMSPEQASGRRTVDHRTDIWSFGIVAFECLTGYHAFAAETLGGLLLAICSDPLPIPSQIAQVPTGFDEWFARCVHREPGLRFLSIAEAADVLRFVCGLEVSASLAMPQLYSEPPATPNSASAPTRAVRPLAYSGGISTTDAPSILTLAESMVLRKRRNNWLYLGGLAVAVLLVAVIFRFRVGPTAIIDPRVTSVTHTNPPLPIAPAPAKPPGAIAELTLKVPVAAAAQLPSIGNNAALADLTAARAKLRLEPPPSKSSHAGGSSSGPAISRDDNKMALNSNSTGNAGVSKAVPKSPPPVAPVASETVENTFGLKPQKKAPGIQ
jgi:serine/threonine-protein kinase